MTSFACTRRPAPPPGRPTRRIPSSPSGPPSFPPAAASPILGVNVENASYGLTSCAERNAVFAAVGAGLRDFSAIAVHAEAGSAPAVRRVPAGAGRVLAVDDRRLPERRRGRRHDRRRASARPLRAVSVEEHRSGIVALAGRPNVGKSTLVNALVGEHVAAVSATPQTTRRRALGVVSRPGYQLILADLPGFQKPFDRLTERMQRGVDAALADADATVLMLDGRVQLGPGDRYIAERLLRPGSAPCVIAVNKTDGLGPDRVLPALAAAAALGDARSIHPVSALKGEGVEELLADARRAPAGGARLLPGRRHDRPARRRSHRGAGARAGASAHARGGAPRGRGRGRRGSLAARRPDGGRGFG